MNTNAYCIKRYLIGAALVFGLCAPVMTSALSVADLQAQIQAPLSRLNELQAQVRRAETPPAVPPVEVMPAHANPRFCDVWRRPLLVGTAGDDVRALQEFLAGEGVFNREATGYFGPVTAEAVRAWQVREGVIVNASAGGAGSFGPRSHEFFMRRCGGGTSSMFRATPQRGSAPLTVTFYANVGGLRPTETQYKIDFGDGSVEQAPECSAPADVCVRPGMTTHTYTMNGTYTARLMRVMYNACVGTEEVNCAAWHSREEVSGTATIVVGGLSGCTFEYAPVCGAKPVACITTPCNPVPTTYENRCAMNRDGASFLYAGACRPQPANPADDPQCRSWFDGCNRCSRNSVGGGAMCTQMACVQGHPIGQEPRPYCISYFNETTRPPVISSFSGPTTLSVLETGTWTIRASDPENQSLSYQVTWGDEVTPNQSMAARAVMEFTQTTTFTHSYARAGTYTVTIVVRDALGQEAKTTTTVRVSGTSSGCVSGGVTYAEGHRRACIKQGGGTTCLADANYICRNGGWSIESSYPPVACTMDARMCPDGTYVGRSGPDCRFVCPSGVILN
jgi:hypothetical protein